MKFNYFIILISMLFACNASPKGNIMENDKSEFIFLEDFDDSLVIYSIINRLVPIEKENLIVKKAVAKFNGKVPGAVDVKKSEIMQNIFSGSYNTSKTEKMCTSVFKCKFYQKDIDDIIIDFQINTNYGNIQKKLPMQIENVGKIAQTNQFLKLIPSIQETNTNTLVFKLLAIRQAPNQGSYMPSSEDFRVVINHSDNGNTWNSSDGQMFMQMVGSVEPQIIGTEKISSLEYKIDQKKFKLNGNNQVNFIIPSLPVPCSVSINYWKK